MPVARGLNGTEQDVKSILSDILHYDYWEYSNRNYRYKWYSERGQVENANKQKARLNTLLEKHQAIFGEALTLDIIGSFLEELEQALKRD